uniref:Uncharacterized protein n=1 Tax=Anguilla anguilla TaxID=7936 RepID=A0A0E9SQ50_ANGAN
MGANLWRWSRVCEQCVVPKSASEVRSPRFHFPLLICWRLAAMDHLALGHSSDQNQMAVITVKVLWGTVV